jgi:hypothetical protein
MGGGAEIVSRPTHTNTPAARASPPAPTSARPSRDRRPSARSLRDHRLIRRPGQRQLLRLETLRDLVAVQPRHPLITDALADVLREIAGSHPRLLQRAGADREITDQLDMRDPARPDITDQLPLHVPADREVDVQAVPARMPLRRPRIRQRPTAKLTPQPTKELAHISADLLLLKAARTRIVGLCYSRRGTRMSWSRSTGCWQVRQRLAQQRRTGCRSSTAWGSVRPAAGLSGIGARG